MKEKATRICIPVLVGAVICTIGISAEDKPKPREKKVGGKYFVHDETERSPPEPSQYFTKPG